ncbi:hypothetical protein A3L04_01370 [Thermococcus chitonophagus]|uniref:DUF998 domain-containing protein n=1 Tax=Thermococcus chitonophagus TaxID=54262 RepID=A0A161KIF6_9EURY|nr:DUF998 domain-containing protein [Thermococcus chitonophagus]ASJ15816.1 hypothetical protein A3L04_01370 [Thermococcus chitonophagus]CUX77048.1 hypothetical protein CHITON_0269 [Thermococcus chitonophagus]
MKKLAYIGPVISVGGVLLSYLIHRDWWRITKNAISDLGKVGLPYNWVMNVSLIIGALLLMIFSASMIVKSEKLQWKISFGVYLLGMFFLALVGIFPEGTSPHYEVSWGFFIFTFLAVLATSISLLLEGDKTGIFGLVVFVVGAALSLWALHRFEGVAVAETIGVIAFLVWHYTLLKRLK